MKLGFDLLLWTTHVTEQHYPILEQIKAAGYDGAEIPIFEGKVEHFEKLGQRLKDIGLEATGIGVMPQGSAISPDAGERQKALSAAMGQADRPAGDLIAELVAALDQPGNLRALGIKRENLDDIAERAMTYAPVRRNPKKISGPGDVREILDIAW